MSRAVCGEAKRRRRSVGGGGCVVVVRVEEGLLEKEWGLGFEVRVSESGVSSGWGVRWKASFEIREAGKSRSGSV